MASCVLSVISPVLLARAALLFQTSSLAKPLIRVQSAACPAQNGRIRPASRALLPSLVWKPLPPSLLPLWQPVPRYACFLKFPSSIITTTLLCAPRCPPRDAAGLSLRASRFQFHPVARSASPSLHGATECLGRRIDRGLDQPELHRTGFAGGYLFGGRLLCLYLPAQAAPLSALLDGRMGPRLPELSGACSLARYRRLAAADSARSASLCRRRNLFLSRRPALCPTP